jgi:hypothetical protein
MSQSGRVYVESKDPTTGSKLASICVVQMNRTK